jgi:hypothetical protein
MTVFLLIAALGFVFLLASFLLDDVFDRFGLFDGAGDAGADGMMWFDSRVLAVFVLAFGGCGAVGTRLGLGAALSAGVGLLGGAALGGAVFAAGRWLYRQQASSSVSAAQLVGRAAQVTVGIRPGGVGQVRCRVGEEYVEKLAHARDGGGIEAGAVVVIEEVADGAVVVSTDERISRLLTPR